MESPRFVLGLDFGTQSARALLVRIPDGREVGSAVYPYSHGVLDSAMPDGSPLPEGFALQHPGDYLEALEKTVTRVLEESGVPGKDVLGLGIDFTACTPLPVLADGTPLCFLPEFAKEPHAWVKLWKHHGAVREAEDLNRAFQEARAPWPARYGGAVNLEWILPKMLETRRKAPSVLERAHRFLEASDWVVWQLTGKEVRGSCAAGYKGCWLGDGYPPEEELARADPSLPGLVDRLLGKEFLPAGRPAGGLTGEWAARLGLEEGTPVSAPIIDAHAAVPGCGVAEPGRMVIILGTSGCHMMLGTEEILVPGIQGVVWEGILPGFYGYEAGQAALGDLFAWFAKNALPAAYAGEAEKRSLDPLALMEEKARAIPPGKSGLVALDWWNGNRSILIDPELRGLVVGFHMGTRPENLFRALLEAAAFGTRVILDHFQAQGLPVKDVVTTGGIAGKNSLFLQILADATGRSFHVARTDQACALGAAVCGAAAAGPERGGFSGVVAAARALAGEPRATFHPDPSARDAYEKVFSLYMELHDHFGRGGTDLMKRIPR